MFMYRVLQRRALDTTLSAFIAIYDLFISTDLWRTDIEQGLQRGQKRLKHHFCSIDRLIHGDCGVYRSSTYSQTCLQKAELCVQERMKEKGVLHADPTWGLCYEMSVSIS